jgi:hypothetical protein
METKRQRTEVWTRVMGYFRPVSGFNKGKKSEYVSRKEFTVAAIDANHKFNEEYKLCR